MKPPNALAIISLCMSKKLSTVGGRVMRRLRSSEAPSLLQPSAASAPAKRRQNCDAALTELPPFAVQSGTRRGKNSKYH